GLDHVDVPEATRRGIWVSNTAGTLTAAVAEYTWGLILALVRRISEGERFLRAGKWRGVSPLFFLGHDLPGKTLGVVGGGRIGRAVMEKAGAFGMRSVYWSRSPREGLAGWRPLDDLLRESDVVVLAVALTPETLRLLDARRLGLLKPTAYLVNVARGAVVDEAALARALLEKRLAGAALDVYEREPEVHPDLLRCENALLAPHLGSATVETRTLMAATAVANLLAGLRGERPPLAVNEPRPRA
ncbi:MAG TPA: NAD(P)-dependent oxidoreductase, partial [Planctomycetota bacterium]|nr:NAD(P)-dependent oxidoreductase [Planctomycetota bacterium]